MPPTLTKKQIGYLQRLVYWTDTKVINEPFTVDLKWKKAKFEPNTSYRVQCWWPTLFQDLQDFADHGYLTITVQANSENLSVAHRGESEVAGEGDSQTLYELTPAGKEAGKWS